MATKSRWKTNIKDAATQTENDENSVTRKVILLADSSTKKDIAEKCFQTDVSAVFEDAVPVTDEHPEFSNYSH